MYIDVEAAVLRQQLHDVQLVGRRRPVDGEPAVVVLPFAELWIDLRRREGSFSLTSPICVVRDPAQEPGYIRSEGTGRSRLRMVRELMSCS